MEPEGFRSSAESENLSDAQQQAELGRDEPRPRLAPGWSDSRIVDATVPTGGDRLFSLTPYAEVPKPEGARATEGGPAFVHGRAAFYVDDCLSWLSGRNAHSVHGVVTDPPYGLVEYTAKENEKRINGKGGVWRTPPNFDGYERSPVPRFSVLTQRDLENLFDFFRAWADRLRPVLVPGAHILVASNPLVSNVLSTAIQAAGYERRGEVIRLVQTMRGGDRPKNAHEAFTGVSVIPRSQYEPWVLLRKPFEGRVQDNLRKWRTGGLRRISDQQPFGDVVKSTPTQAAERELAPHPSLKPQAFLRQVVRAILPLGEGVILDPFAGSGSTLAAAETLGYSSIGVEKDPAYLEIARTAIPKLAEYHCHTS